MRSNSESIYRFINPKMLQFYIIISWTIGFYIGLHIFSQSFDELVWKPALQKPIPLAVRIFLLSFVPIVLTAAYRKQKKTPAIILICFFRSILFGISLSLVSEQFRSGIWLAMSLLLFSDIVSVCLLLWFCLRQGRMTDCAVRRYLYIICGALVVVSLVDAFVIAPFLQRIL